MNYDDQSRCCRDAKQNYSFFVLGMLSVGKYFGVRIFESTERFFKPDSMLLTIGPVLTFVPIEAYHV